MPLPKGNQYSVAAEPGFPDEAHKGRTARNRWELSKVFAGAGGISSTSTAFSL
jgi:hypothetical protein